MSKTPESHSFNETPDRLAEKNGKKNISPTTIGTTVSSNSSTQLSQKTLSSIAKPQPLYMHEVKSSNPWLLLTSAAIMGLGLGFNISWLGFSAGVLALLLSLQIILPSIRDWVVQYLTPQERDTLIGFLVFILAITGLAKYVGFYQKIGDWLNQFKYDEFGSWAEWVGALGQIMIALLAVYVAWAQYVISKDLTIQQNRITQQQTIDTYFQGISDLVLNEEGMLEDWPQERSIAEGRTAAILSSVDEVGKAKILRFLSQSKLLTPLMRDSRLGRPILDGFGGYAEDRVHGVRVINLGVMLAGANLSGQDLRWTDLSEANMVRADLSWCGLVKANLSRTVLYDANLKGSDLKETRLFYGSVETASPRSRSFPPNYETGAYTGVVLENCNLMAIQNLTEEQRYYCCAWGGEKTRATISGGCCEIPNKLDR
ncbi:rfrA pentapeptide repeat-containing protein [cyanobacterium endosymbiont of Rhopalodia gibberula]|uniref:pentapeptide repeat-containing protein n=1 Tax=cyanobacterium endosymbiont of Rhopalodia gibberula TaxID=1763363 RepID=UPI000DC70036|nr:pentapeptide repeat-containing protein [cyanobacterium endosymbiont of Rhopalodia gibberula]BBA79087.1 rfrA pentapeptide repeat-containing protein [cyanobacterium endosymbiont of Rhopalodia gibberula]